MTSCRFFQFPPHERADWLERLRERCRGVGGFTDAQWDTAYADILARSDVIRYVNLGNPEAILISDERVSGERWTCGRLGSGRTRAFRAQQEGGSERFRSSGYIGHGGGCVVDGSIDGG